MSFTAPVEGKTTTPRKAGAKKNDTDWDVVAHEFKRHPNAWRVLTIAKYSECSYSRAKYAGKRLRDRGLDVDYHQHYEEFPVPDPETGEPTVLREMLDTYSVHAMYVFPKEHQ